MLKRLGKTGVGCGLIIVLMFACVGVSFFAFDRLCYGHMTQRLPIYPNAEIISRRHNFMTEFGIGETVMTLYSLDPPEEVQAWYARETGGYLRRALQSGDPTYRLAQGDWSVAADDERGTGSAIILFGTCVQ